MQLFALFRPAARITVLTFSLTFAQAVPTIQVSSGGVSEGAYQGGYLMGHDWLHSSDLASDTTRLRKSIQVGASAGAINTLGGANNFFLRSRANQDFQTSAYRHWLDIGIDGLVDFTKEESLLWKGRKVNARSASLFSRKVIGSKLDMVIAALLDPTNKRDDSVIMGFSLTRVEPKRIPIATVDSAVQTQNQAVEIAVSLKLAGGVFKLCEEKVRSNSILGWFRGEIENERPCVVDRDRIRAILKDLVLASSTFPLAFAQYTPVELIEPTIPLKKHDPKDSVTHPLFADGGVFSNQPFQIGWNLARNVYAKDSVTQAGAPVDCPRAFAIGSFDSSLFTCDSTPLAKASGTDTTKSTIDSTWMRDSTRHVECLRKRDTMRTRWERLSEALRKSEDACLEGVAKYRNNLESYNKLEREAQNKLKLAGYNQTYPVIRTIFIDPENYGSSYRSQSKNDDSLAPPGADWLKLTGTLFNSARNMSLADFVAKDPSWQTYQKMAEVNHTRIVPTSSYLGAFAGFLARDFREFDLALGLVDACLDYAARWERTSTPDAVCQAMFQGLRLKERDSSVHTYASSILGLIAAKSFNPTKRSIQSSEDYDIKNYAQLVDSARNAKPKDKAGQLLKAVILGQGATSDKQSLDSLFKYLPKETRRDASESKILIRDRLDDYFIANRKASKLFSSQKVSYMGKRHAAGVLGQSLLLDKASQKGRWGIEASQYDVGMVLDWIPRDLSSRFVGLGLRSTPIRLRYEGRFLNSMDFVNPGVYVSFPFKKVVRANIGADYMLNYRFRPGAAEETDKLLYAPLFRADIDIFGVIAIGASFPVLPSNPLGKADFDWDESLSPHLYVRLMKFLFL